MSLFLQTLKETHRAVRQVSQGAGISLLCKCGEYQATFDCATRIAGVLGNRELQHLGDGITESIPLYKIPFEDTASVLAKLTEKFSVALIDLTADRTTTRFCLIWKIDPSRRVDPADDPAFL